MKLTKNSKIFLAGHNGMVGSAIKRKLIGGSQAETSGAAEAETFALGQHIIYDLSEKFTGASACNGIVVYYRTYASYGREYYIITNEGDKLNSWIVNGKKLRSRDTVEPSEDERKEYLFKYYW
mgnify:CR=1 FL=1